MDQPQKKCTCKFAAELALVLLASLAFTAKVVVSIYAWWGDASSLGLLLSLPEAFKECGLPISPVLWTSSLWLVQFVCELLGLLFAWRFIINWNVPRTIFLGFYPTYALASLLHIGWLFCWCRQLQEAALAIMAMQTLILVACVGQVSTYLYVIRGDLRFFYVCNFKLTRVLILNSSVVYATLSSLLALFNIGAVLTKKVGLDGGTVSTVILSLLSSLLVTYFMLENTILDRFLRYVYAVYPVVIWTLAGVLAQTGVGRDSLQDRNVVFVLVLTCMVGMLAVLRVILWVVYISVRPLPEYEIDEPETVPV